MKRREGSSTALLLTLISVMIVTVTEHFAVTCHEESRDTRYTSRVTLGNNDDCYVANVTLISFVANIQL